MKIEVYYPTGKPDVTLTCYIQDQIPEEPGYKHDAMLVLPGGGYQIVSEREGEPVALEYLAKGFNAFVLKYSTGANALYPQPLIEASLSVKYIKDNAERFNINPDRVFAVGFSAGGHLAGALGTFWNAPFLTEKLDIPYGSNKPAGVILGYPVLTSGKFTHRETFCTILGTQVPTEEELMLYSVEKHVSKDTVPSFVFHTADDTCVPVQNSLLYALALSEKQIPYKLIVFPSAPHGISTASRVTSINRPEWEREEITQWVPMSIEWMKTIK